MTPATRNAGFAALAAGVCVVLFLSCFEQKTITIPEGASLEARRNPYLAAGWLLERMGLEVVTFEDAGGILTKPLPAQGTLLLPTQRRTLSDARQRELLEWVHQGGHLIVVTYSLFDDPDREPDPILDELGLEQYQHIPPEPSDEESTEPAPEPLGEPETGDEDELEFDPEALLQAFETNAPGEWDRAEIFVPTEDGVRILEVDFDPRWYWVDRGERSTWGAAGASGPHLLQLPHGDGIVSALTDEFFLRNAYIGENDHAELALRLVTSERGAAAGPVWIVAAEEREGLASLAWKHAALAIVSLAVLVALFVWRGALRFGPVLPLPPTERRSLLEQVDAIGTFHWRRDRGNALLRGVRASVRERIRALHPAWSRLPPGELAGRIADITDLRAEDVAVALDGPASEASTPTAFTFQISILERIRSSL